jgi:cell division protein FtsI (penicillin-binding protein 3)
MLRAHAIIANEGLEVKPTLLKKIVKNIDGEDRVIVDNTKNFELSNRKRVLSKDVCKLVKHAMKYTTKSGGSAPAADLPGYTEAGKTGTAEKITDGHYNKDVHISSFIGFAPVEKPRFVLIVVIDEPEKKYVAGLGKIYQGGVCAAPVFKEIALRSLNYLGVAPDDPFGYPYPDTRRDTTKADWSKEIKKLSDLYKSWN